MKKLVLSCAVAVAVLCILEFTARRVGPGSPHYRSAHQDGAQLIAHPTRLWAMAPGEREIAGVAYSVGTDGLRGVPVETPRPQGRERILLLGDSTWFGHGVPDDATMGAQLEGGLRQLGLDVDVVNAALPGYSTEQTAVLLEEQGWALEPTLLLIGSLWSDASFDAFQDRDLLMAARVRRNSLLRYTALYRLLAINIDRLRGGEGVRLVGWPRSDAWPTTGTRRVPVQDYAANLDAMIRAARTRGIGVALLAPGNQELASRGLRAEASWSGHFDAQRRVALHHGIPLVEGYRVLQQSYPLLGADGLFVDDLHPSQTGHLVLARETLRVLRAAGWPEQRLLGRDEPFSEVVPQRSRTFPEAARDIPHESPQRRLFMAAEE